MALSVRSVSVQSVRVSLLAACMITAAAGCRSTFNPPEYDRLRASEAGEVVLDSLEAQGYERWSGEEGLVFNLRTRKGPPSDLVITRDAYSLDLNGKRIHAQWNEGAKLIRGIYAGGEYEEVWDGRGQLDLAVLLSGRWKLTRDYFFTALPFLLGRSPSEMKILKDVAEGKVRYHVVEVRFERDGYLPPDPWYRLYYRGTTRRLEKVFFQAGGGDLREKYIWCEFDNFGDVDGALIPLHRKFTLAEDEHGARTGGPCLEQWLFEVQFESLDEDLFTLN